MRSEMRGVSSRMAARPRRISSRESNFWSMRFCRAVESAGVLMRAAAVSRWRQRRRELMASAPVRSPAAAAAAARSNWSVTLAMALTTTTGCLPCATRPATMAAVRPMAAGSSTEVPPNFMTTRLMRIFPSSSGARGGYGHGLKLAQAGEQLCIQNGGAGGSANGVVREHGELPVEHRAGAQAAHGNGHAVAAVAVEARLGTVGLRSPFDGLIGSCGQLLTSKGTELSPGGEQVFAGHWPAELVAQLDGHAFRVAVFDRHSVALRAYPGC